MDDTPASPKTAASTGVKLTKAETRELSIPPGWRRYSPLRFHRTNHGLRVKIEWRRALLALVLLAILGWLGSASAAYLFVKYRRGFSDVRLVHMLFYPIQKEDYRLTRGNFLVNRAKEQVESGKFREAFYGLRIGINLAPRNRDGRMMLAQFHVLWQRPDLALINLTEGLTYGIDDQEYLHVLFGLLVKQQSDFELLRITDDLIGKAGADPVIDERMRMIAMAKASALFLRGNYDSSEDTLRKFRLLDTPDGAIMSVRIDWERGDRDLALLRLEELSLQYPDDDQIYHQFATYLRDANRTNELRRLALLRQLAYPDRPRSRIDLLYIYDKNSDNRMVETGISDIFRDFPANGEVMLALADFAANTGRPALARRVYDHCRSNDLPWEGAALMTIEAHIVAKEYREALVTSAEMQKADPEWGKRFAAVFSGMHAIAHFGLADNQAAQLFLTNFLTQANVRADNLVAVSNRLVSVGAHDQARSVLSQAVRSDPLNQTALTSLIRLELEAGKAETATTHIKALLNMRKPPVDLLREAYEKLASDRYLLTPGMTPLLDSITENISSRKTTQIKG